jgi:large subunit ribosomal protein L31
MKKEIHPEYFENAQVICACGYKFTTGSTKKEIKVELCSQCHPFYTGKQKLVDSARRVEKYSSKLSAQEKASKERKGKKVKRAIRDKSKDKKEVIVRTKDIKKIAQVKLNSKKS